MKNIVKFLWRHNVKSTFIEKYKNTKTNNFKGLNTGKTILAIMKLRI